MYREVYAHVYYTFRILLDYNMFLERSDQGLGLQISQLARNLLCNTSTDNVMALTVIVMYVIMCAALSLTYKQKKKI